MASVLGARLWITPILLPIFFLFLPWFVAAGRGPPAGLFDLLLAFLAFFKIFYVEKTFSRVMAAIAQERHPAQPESKRTLRAIWFWW